MPHENVTTTRRAETFYVSPQHALKALGDGRIGGYLAAFGLPRDKQGEYFDRDTEFHLDWYGDGPRPVLYHHGLDADAQADAIGHVVALAPDEFGLFATAELDMLNPLAQKVYEQICKGRIGWSSGSIPHLVRVADDGKIAEWPIVEASLTPTPAEPFRTNVQALKAMITAWEGETAALDRAIEVDGETNAPAAPDRPAAPDAPALDTDTLDETQPVPARAAKAAPRARKGKIMDTPTIMAALEKAGLSADQIVAVLKELGAQGAEMEAPEAEAPAEAIMADVPPEDEQQPEIKASAGAPVFDAKAFARTIRAELDAAQKAAPGQPRAVPFTGNGNGRKAADIQVYSKYRGLKAADMAFLMHLRGAIARQSGLVHQPGDAYVREMTIKAQKEISDGSLVVEPRVAQRILAIKDNENNSRGVTTDGSDWTTTVMSSDLWERARVDNQVLANLNTVEMPSDSYDLPIESTDPTVYAVAETTNEAQLTLVTNGTFTDSKVTVGKVTLNAAKMGLQVRFSAEINEDSVIPFIPQLRTQSLRAMQDAIDNVILNADATTGTGNINYKGANTSAAATSKFLYGGGDGVRHLALVDNTDLAVDAGGAAPTLTLWRSALSKMTNAYSVRPADIVAFCDVQTYHKLKGIDELLVYMNNGRGSTVVDGMVPTIDGSPVYPSAELALTDSTGYAMAAGTGTQGQVVFVYKPGWYVGYRRQIASAVDYLAYYDAYVLTMTVRLALARRDTGVAALLYNLAV